MQFNWKRSMPDSTPYNIQITLEEEIEIKKQRRQHISLKKANRMN
jgi:hypothetical protein